jgi:hypothetical protein
MKLGEAPFNLYKLCSFRKKETHSPSQLIIGIKSDPSPYSLSPFTDKQQLICYDGDGSTSAAQGYVYASSESVNFRSDIHLKLTLKDLSLDSGGAHDSG